MNLPRLLESVMGADGLRYEPSLRRLAGYVARESGADFDDVVQDFLVRFLLALRTFRGQSSTTTYVRSVARNSAVTLLRKATRGRRFALAYEQYMLTVPVSTSTDSVVASVSARRDLRQIMAEFSSAVP